MKSYIAFLRGINVSGKNKILMGDLKSALNIAGFSEVKTYIQSGNIILRSVETETENVEEKIEECIKAQFSYNISAIVLTVDHLKKILEELAFVPGGDIRTNRLFFCLLKSEPAPEDLSSLKGLTIPGEYFQIRNNVIYIYVPNGFGRAKINNNFFEQKLNVEATTRNWNTMHKMLELQ